MKNFPSWQAVSLLVGSVVGAGFLGIPYVVARVGFPAGLLLIVGIGLLIMVQYLAVAEMTLRTAGQHQIVGYIEKYLGKSWKNFIFTLVVLEGYGVLLAYIVGEGQVLSAIFGGSALVFSYVFFVCVALIVYFGLRLIQKIDLFLTLLMSAVVIGLALGSWSAIRFDNFLSVNFEAWLPAYGVILFSFLGVAAIPEMRLALTGKEHLFQRAVVVGSLIPIFIYTLFTFAVLGVIGMDTTTIATIGLGNALGRGVIIVGNLLAAITMTTSFLGMALALKETFRFDMKFKPIEAWLLTLLAPLILFSFGLHNFITIIGFVGAVLGGGLGVALVFAWWRAESRGDREPEFSLPYKKFLGILLFAIFVLGVFYSMIDFFRS